MLFQEVNYQTDLEILSYFFMTIIKKVYVLIKYMYVNKALRPALYKTTEPHGE